MTQSATTKSPFGMCDCTVDSDVGRGDFSLVQGILHVCGHTYVELHLPQGMDSDLHKKVWESSS